MERLTAGGFRANYVRGARIRTLLPTATYASCPRPVSGLVSGGSRPNRLPVLSHSGWMTRIDSLTVAGAVPE